MILRPKLLSTIVALLCVLAAVRCVNLPNCQTNPFYKILPLTPNQAYYIDVSSLFSGYNLRFNAKADPDLQKYIQLTNKTGLLKEQYPDVALQGLKSLHMAKMGNSWGQQFIALTEKGEKSLVHYGILSDNRTVPVINNYINVQNFTNTTCYDSILLPLSNTIVVDCAQKKAAPNSRGQIYQNIFYYFRISDGNKTKELPTEMYVPFDSIARRKLDIYHDVENGHTFVLRTYTADKMGETSRDNTYVEVIMMQDPSNPWVVGVIDRSFLGLPRLRIADIKVYQGQIYILDELAGVHRVQINGAEDLLYLNSYEAKGFTRLAVFSPNLDNRIEIALSNDHSVHQIDWTDVDEPRLLNKYSLLPGSTVIQLFLNDRFLFVRSSATDSNVTYNYSWVFIRGDRTFSKAFLTMSHGLSSTLIDVNEALSYILVVNDQSISNYYVDDPSFRLVFDANEDLLNTQRSFTLSTYSTDSSTPSVNISCELTINFTLLDENNRTMWEVGSAPASKYSANYPGKLKIQLGEYILGPNVTYSIRQAQKGTLKGKILQNEQLQVSWQVAPPFTNITFLQTETLSGSVSDTLMIYMQDTSNKTYISYCYPHHERIQVHCNRTEVKELGGQITDWETTMVRNPYTQTIHHLLAYTTATYYNTIFLRDLSDSRDLDKLSLGSGFPGNISSLSITGKYMFAVLRHIKRINIYPLDQCIADNCFSICNINHMTMFRLGVPFFAPQVVHTSRFHPDLLFIKTSDSIIAMDLSKQCVPQLLAIIRPVENANTEFVFEVNSNFLVVTVAPNLVQEYDVSRIYLKEVRKTKPYPLYGYKLPKNYDFDISDYGNCVYLSTITEGGDYNIFVYRSGFPAVSVLYNQIDLYAYQNLLIDASGYIIDYLTVITTKELRIFRQYEKPEAEVENADKDYEFYLQYLNTLDTVELQKISVTVINLPTYITVSPFLSDIMNTKDLFYSGQNRLSEVNDSDWYKGNVLTIRADCADCPDKIRINNHIQQEDTAFVIPALSNYLYTPAGGELLAQTTLIRLMTNGSISEIVEFPRNPTRHCLEVALSRHRYTIVGCVQNDNVFLQVVSGIGKKGFAFQLQETNAQSLLRLQATHNLVMLVDADSDCYRKKRPGGIFLYEISEDLQTNSPLTEIQYIDGDDFNMKELGTINFNNAELIYNAQNKIYRLYISEMNRGLLIIEFTHSPGKSAIVVRQVYLVPLRIMLTNLGQSLPYDATFQAITLMTSSTDMQAKKTTQRLLVTTGRYHTLQLVLQFDFSYSLINKYIERLYLRYSYYEVSNEIKQNGGLFLVRQQLPDQYNSNNQTQQLYTVYSIAGDFNGTVEKRGLIGALTLRENALHRFDFNKTLNEDDLHVEPRVGLVVVEESGQLIKASLHRNLSLFTTELVDTQIIYLDLINDFNLQKIRILINGRSPFPEWKLITIIIFSILGGILLLGVAFVMFQKWRVWNEANKEQRETLLSEESNNVAQS